MGATIRLNIFPNQIRTDAWARIYDDTLHLLGAHPSGMLASAVRTYLGTKLTVHVTKLERNEGGRHWSVCGDRGSLQMGDCFSMPRKLPAARWDRHGDPGDIVWSFGKGGWDGVPVFDGDTGAKPYHQVVLATAMLVETRLPKAAIVWGNIDEQQADQARRWVESVLGHPVAMPVLLDAPRLLERLRLRWKGTKLARAFVERYAGYQRCGLYVLFRYLSAQDGVAWLSRVLDGRCIERKLITNAALFGAWLEAGGDAGTLCKLGCKDPQGPRMRASEFAENLAYAGMFLPPAVRARAERVAALPLRGRVAPTGHVERYLLERLLGSVRSASDGSPWSMAAAAAALGEVFSDSEARLLRIVQGQARHVQGLIELICDRIEQVVRSEDALGPFQDLGTLASLDSAERLSEERRQHLAILLHILDDSWVAGLRGSDVRTKKKFLVRTYKERGLCFTEEAWGWILSEKDTSLLDLLQKLVFVDGEDAMKLCRALFENRVLCEEAMRIQQDEALMAQARQWIAETRGRDKKPARRKPARRKKT